MDTEMVLEDHQLRGFKVLSEQVSDLRNMARNPRQRTRTGLAKLDDLILGPAAGEIFTVVARSYVGKSLIATNIMANNPDAAIVFFSLEMPAHQVLQRLYAHMSERSGRDITNMVLSNQIPPDLDDLQTQLERHVVVDADGLTLADMSVYLDSYEGWFGQRPDVVIIDYLEEIGGAKASGEGWIRTEATASALKQWSRKEKIAVFSLHQANQKTEQWEPPTSNSAKGGGYTESDVVVGMWRPGWDPELGDVAQKQQFNDLNINVIKNRITGRSAPELTFTITPAMRIIPLFDQAEAPW